MESITNAYDAINRLQNHDYNLILLDIKMPGMSGIELYKNLEQINSVLAKKVISITGDVTGQGTNSFFSENNVPYIAKPFDIDKLMSEINRML